MEPVDLLCSRNAHDKNVLVRRAQWEINQPPSLRDNERAWKEHLDGWWSSDVRSRGRLGHSLREEQQEAEGPRWTRSLG
jgi:hypothetical protein